MSVLERTSGEVIAADKERLNAFLRRKAGMAELAGKRDVKFCAG
jgi:hypothetical protein